MRFNEFLIEDYDRICRTIKKSKYRTITLQKYFEEKPEKDFIILRHDVDYNINDALKMAEIELSHGINSTYFIRLNKKASAKKIKQLNSIASEIGLHYDALAKTQGHVKSALAIFTDQFNFLNTIVEVKTISAHGSSIHKIKNIGLLQNLNMNHFKIIGDAMVSVDFENLPYYSDAGRTWKLKRNKLNDFPTSLCRDYKYIDKSSELCSLLAGEFYDTIYLSSHPELWAKNFYFDFFKEIKYGRMRFLLKKCIKCFK